MDIVKLYDHVNCKDNNGYQYYSKGNAIKSNPLPYKNSPNLLKIIFCFVLHNRWDFPLIIK